MKEAFWGVLIVILGLFGIVVVNVFQNVTVDNDRVYYVIKESTEASAFDALDLTYYRLSGKLRIVEDKFVENLTRRFAENITPGDYIITVQDVNEMPPKVSLKVRSGITSLRGEEFGIVNRVDGILETKYPQDEIKDFVGEDNNKNIYDGDICNSVINNDELECMPGDIRFDGFEDVILDNAVCQDETPKQNVKRIAKYSICDCGSWSEKKEDVYASPVKQNNEHVYTWTFTKTSELRTISESIKKRVLIQMCTTGIGIMVPNDIDKVNQDSKDLNGENIKLPYQPSIDNSKYIACPSGGIKIPIGMSFVAHPNYIPELSVNRNLDWDVDDTNILGIQSSSNQIDACILNDKGTNCFDTAFITANQIGVTNINVKTKRKNSPITQSATCKVEVYDGKVDSVGCNNISLSINNNAKIQVNYSPKNATIYDFTYSVSNTSVATISGNTITAKAGGSATITVKETNTGKTGTCTVTVPSPPAPPSSYVGNYSGGSTTDNGGYWKVVDSNGRVTYYQDYDAARKAAVNVSNAGTATISYKNSGANQSEIMYSTINTVGSSYGGTTTELVYNGNLNAQTQKKETNTLDYSSTSTKDLITGKETVTTTRCNSNKCSSSSGGGGGSVSNGGYTGGGSTSSGGNKGSTSTGTTSKPATSSPSKGETNRGSGVSTPAPKPAPKPAPAPAPAPSKPSSSGSTCLAKGTKIKLANGKEKNVEDITYDDLLMVWNYETGSYTYEYPIWIEKEGKAPSYIKIEFDDGTYLNIVEDHGIYDVEKNKYVNIGDLKVGSKIAKIIDNKVKHTTITAINEIKEDMNYYHIVSTRYYNVIANDVLTTDYIVLLSNFRGFNSDITWKTLKYTNDELYSYKELNYLPYYLYKGFRAEEAKVFDDVLDKQGFMNVMKSIILNPDRITNPKTNLLGNRMWMVTTSDDELNLINKFKYLREEGSKYVIPQPSNKDNFINWYNTSDGKYYNSGDEITVYTGIHLVAIYE